ncbi:MAG: hypothetical protein ACRC4M_03960 [Mycoplasma sp.]
MQSNKRDTLKVIRKQEPKKVSKQPKPIEAAEPKAKAVVQKPVAPVVQPQVAEKPAPVIQYSKWNPKLTDKKAHMWWNILKFSAILLTLVFAILGLYFSSIWQVTNGQGFLLKLGHILDKSTIANPDTFIFAFEGMYDATEHAQLAALMSTIVGNVTAAGFTAQTLAGSSLMDLTFYKTWMNIVLMVVSIVSIVTTIPLLVFKNRTVWSLSFLITQWALVIFIVAIFAIGLSAQQSIVNPINGMRHLISQWLQVFANGKTPDLAALAKVENNILLQSQKLVNILSMIQFR